MAEIWKPVVGYEGYYEVSNLGRMRSLDRMVNHKSGTQYLQRGQILAPRFRDGYVSTAISKFGKTKYCRIHRLVAQAFIPNPENKPTVNHKNGNKLDNSVENLEWATQSENQIHAIRTGLVKRESILKAIRIATEKQSIGIYCPELDMHFPSIKATTRYMGIAGNTIRTSIRENRPVHFRKEDKYYTFIVDR